MQIVVLWLIAECSHWWKLVYGLVSQMRLIERGWAAGVARSLAWVGLDGLMRLTCVDCIEVRWRK